MASSRRIPWGRVRVPAAISGLIALLVALLFDAMPTILGVGLFLIGIALYLRLGGPPAREPVDVRAPVSGRWRALNSPADRVPSHGLHAYGQTFAIDLVHEPPGDGRPDSGWWPLTRSPEEFPGFGEPILSPVDGVVVSVRDGARDHRTRDSWPAMALLFLEGGFRELTGPQRLLGNHVVIDAGECTYAVLAHLQRGSIRVAEGERVRGGEEVGRCGNSGNSSEPHLHFQLMDHPQVAFADGVPFEFDRFEEGGAASPGVPHAARPFIA